MEDDKRTGTTPRVELRAGQTWIDNSGQEIILVDHIDNFYPFTGISTIGIQYHEPRLYTTGGRRFGETSRGPSYLIKLKTRYDWTIIPTGYDWAATDSDGEQIACTTRPVNTIISTDEPFKPAWWKRVGLDYLVIPLTRPKTPCFDWKNSVEQRPTQLDIEQPTEIDLAKPVRLKQGNGSIYYVVGPHRSSEGSVVIERMDDGRISSIPLCDIENIPVVERPISIIVYLCKRKDGTQYLTASPFGDAIIVGTSIHSYMESTNEWEVTK